MAISAMKTWVSRCQSHHSCGAGNDVNLPTRVIDLKPMDEGRNPLLFETAGQRGVYIALSYCWGDNQEFKNTNSNYHEFRTNGIEYSKLAQTLKDAIQITRLLGVRYIWIDAICIIQSMEGQSEIGNEDFNREGLRMQDYYGNSSLTILVGSASDCNHGFLEARRGRLQNALPSVPFEYTRHDGIKAGHIYAELYSSYQVGPLEQRAWTLQEDILSPRLLIFGKDQMGYRCGIGEVWEDGTSNLAKWDGKGLFDVSPRMILAVNTSTTDGRARDRMLRQWYPMLQKYTRRQRSNPYDKLTAIAGIAQHAHQLIGGRYLFGLWETDIIRGLLWRSGWLPGDPDPPLSLNRVDAFKAPSWSWASTEGPIFCQYTTERQERTYLCSAKIRAEFLSCCDGFDNHFDPIRSGVSLDLFRLRIRGTVKAVQCAAGTVLPLTDKCKRKTYYKYRNRMINLVPNELGNSCSASPIGTIAVALTDTPVDHTEGYWCLRLITEEGLLLKHLKNSEYERVGVFLVSDVEWFDRGKPEIIELL
jgi:Heterokaryon incompatibility protein (HET)